jgi:hypothetical protein
MLRCNEARRLVAIALLLLFARIAGATCDVDPAGTPCADDGNPCSLDVCDGQGTCVHPTGGQAACDDGNPCTIDDVCGDGVCAGTVAPGSCIDAALCYRTRAEAGFPPTTLKFVDGISISGGHVREPVDFCLPARTDGGATIAPAISLASYRTRGGASPSPRPLTITDQFGTFDAQVRTVNRVLVATTTSPTDPPPAPPAPRTANQYACRRLRATKGTSLPTDIPVSVEDPLGTHAVVLLQPKRWCSPADIDVPNTGIAHPRTGLLCYRAVQSDALPSPLEVHTANQLGLGSLEIDGARELCVPASAQAPASPCLTSGDECGLPCCREYDGQKPDCGYEPFIPNPRYLGCAGPTVLVDRTHVNFHQVTPESDSRPGRFWGFAKQLVRDGYVVRDNLTPFDELLPATPARIIVIANPRTLAGDDAVPPADVAALVSWIEQGGSLLLSIDHPPYERTGALLAALGLVRSGERARQFTFTRAAGSLNGAATIANGDSPSDAVDEVTTFTGTPFSIDPAPPPQAQYEPLLTFPPDAPGDLAGLLQGVAIQFGAGRVYVSGESGGLTAQTGFGMQDTPDNEQFLRNVVHWLDS